MRWGLIGTHGYASQCAAPGIRSSQRGELASVLGRDPEHSAEFARENSAAPFTDPDAFLASGIDAVWVTSPTWLHHDQTIAALEAGLHVLCEKPLAATAKDAWAMVRAAARAGKILATGYQGRYVPGHRTMLTIISDGTIGDVTIARTYWGVHRPGPPPEWRQRKETARWGALADTGTHHIDLLRMLLGEITDAYGMRGHQLGFETEDVAAASFRFESSVLATLTVTVNVWKQQTRVEIYGTRGLLVATNTHPAGTGDVFLFDRRNESGRNITGTRPASIWATQIDRITDAATGEDVPYATGEDGARNVEVLEALLAS